MGKSPTRRMLSVLGPVFAALVATPVLSAGTAHADDVDNLVFLAYLNEHGVTYGSAETAIQAGQQVCRQLRGGVDPWDVRNYWVDRLGTPQKASGLIVAASSYLCYEQLEILDNYYANQPPDIP